MSHTSMQLGSNWARGEWPEHVDVQHPGDGFWARYVPERICRNEATCPGVLFECSECGGESPGGPDHEVFGYCPYCGARVVGNEHID